ncbi:hypothetical protein [Quadrisphaera sp. DSM 44207]|uniref:hypothetical protein n=1 Tax=Quadrisphaera sp. DSM 44207 TaxID=1881057 RepID=UPI00087F148F|nr:hypothetical protein [Quadrisphaera sp. DSM 44207]SDQ68417.1 hypothetical protein SAMN05428996_2377 [Quadrisphaera sp. DSM 44207]
MTAPRTLAARSRRVAATVAALGLAAAAWAPSALAHGYSEVAPPATTTTVPTAAPATDVAAARPSTAPGSSALAHTGVEAGGLALGGAALVVAGALLVRGGRRSSASAA